MRSVIFDFNGTLFPDTPIHLEAWREFFARYDVYFTDDLFHRYMCGPPNSAIMRRFIRPDLTDDEVMALAEEKEAIYRGMVVADPRLQSLTPGASEMLDAMKAAGIPFAIATGSNRGNCDFYMDVLGIDRWFDYDHLFYAEGHLPGKPDPAIYRLALQKLGFDAKETIVFEDALPGVESAIGAGIDHIVAIDTTLGPDGFAGIPQVRRVVHDFRDFRDFIPGLC